MADDDLLACQIDYYRRRAPEYDETAVGEVDYAALVERLAPRGDVLEIACGTGLWTQHLAPRAHTLTALDSSPEMIALARSRVGEEADFVVANVFRWEPPRRFDSIFFGFWLSHVPPTRFEEFWRLVDNAVDDGGRVLFVDEGAPRAWREEPDRCVTWDQAAPPLDTEAALPVNASRERAAPAARVLRRLRDGSVHTIVKIFYDPDELARALASLGWSADVGLTEDDLIVGVVHR
jgi:SAM-dependent methyltransferase